MPIAVTCTECGASMKVKDELAGKRIRCRQCSEVVAVPRPAEDDDALLDQLVEEEHASETFDEETAAAPRARRKSAAKPERPAKSRSGAGGAAAKSFLVIGVVAAVSLLVLCGGGAAVMMYLAQATSRSEMESVDRMIKNTQGQVGLAHYEFDDDLIRDMRDDCADYSPIRETLRKMVDMGKLTIAEIDGLPMRSDSSRAVMASTKEWIVAQEAIANGPIAEMLQILDDHSRPIDDRYQDVLAICRKSKVLVEAAAVKQATAHKSYLVRSGVAVSPDYDRELLIHASPHERLFDLPPTRQAIGMLKSDFSRPRNRSGNNPPN